MALLKSVTAAYRIPGMCLAQGGKLSMDSFELFQVSNTTSVPKRGQVLIVDDHPLFVQAMAEIVTMVCPGSGVHACTDMARALAWLAQPSMPMLVVLDLGLADSDGLATVARIRDCVAGVPLLVVSGERDSAVIAAVRKLSGTYFVSKSATPAVLIQAVRELTMVQAGAASSGSTAGGEAGLGLSARQWQVLGEMATGKSNKEIAIALQMSPETVKAHVKAILERLAVRNRTEAVSRFIANKQRVAKALGT